MKCLTESVAASRTVEYVPPLYKIPLDSLKFFEIFLYFSFLQGVVVHGLVMHRRFPGVGHLGPPL